MALLASCQGHSDSAPAAGSGDDYPIVVRGTNGDIQSRLRPGHPCRASIDGFDVIAGGPPFVAQFGKTRWSGATSTDGMTLSRDGAQTVRVFPELDRARLGVFDAAGGAIVRVTATADGATVRDAGGTSLRTLAKRGDKIEIAGGPSVTGTDDLVLAALVTAPEISAELRALLACDRLLAGGGGAEATNDRERP
jgi:hypothetical protein